MSNTGLDSFDDTVQQTNILLKDIINEFGWDERRDMAYDVLRAVIQTLRDRLTVEEAVQFGAQLPMLVRGFYYEGWRPSEVPKKMHKEEFFAEVRKKFPFDVEQSNEDLIRGVLLALTRFVSKGEMDDIKGILPKDLGQVLEGFWKEGNL
ncbi:DUF2267 domain-containing protein [Candidatus Parcubacteria bacterium]|nr:MAG: DUF2267 domain-containing protein [Candidatus Parcubacteria bacterium]